MTIQSLLQRIEEESKAADLSISDLEVPGGLDDLCDGQVTGRLGPLRVRFVRDRGQDWLELGPADTDPPRFFSLQDVQIALGWKTIAEVLDMRDVEPLGDVPQACCKTLARGFAYPSWAGLKRWLEARGEGSICSR